MQSTNQSADKNAVVYLAQIPVHHKQAYSLSRAPAYMSKHIVHDTSFQAVSILSFSRPLELLDSLAGQEPLDMELPDELTLQMLGYREKYELKTAKLLCKVWFHHASEFLFDKLYISPQEEDIRSSRWLRNLSGYASMSRNSSMVSFFSCQTSRRGSTFAC